MTKKTKPEAAPVVKTDKTFSTKNSPFDEAMPIGFNFEQHKPIKRALFTHDKHYFAHRAEMYDFRAAKNRILAEEAGKFGDRKQRQAARRLERLNAQINELTTQLKSEGVDVDALLLNE